MGESGEAGKRFRMAKQISTAVCISALAEDIWGISPQCGKFYCAGNSFSLGGGGIQFVAPLMFQRATTIGSAYITNGPSAAAV